MPVTIQNAGRPPAAQRFLDAHEIQELDFNVVTRPQQNNNTQHWELRDTGGGFTIQQVSSGRFLDAHEIESLDFRVVTRPQQNNNTQLWRIIPAGGGLRMIQQVSSGRFLEPYLTDAMDFQVVTRLGRRGDDPNDFGQQLWRIVDVH